MADDPIDNSPTGVFAEALQTINRFVRSRSFERQDRPVTRVQWILLRTVSRNPGLTVGQLAERVDVRQATMSQMLDRLEKGAYVTRTPSSQDARVKTVQLTAEGAALIRQMETEWKESLEGPFAALSDDDRNMLAVLMRRLAQVIQGGTRE